MSKSVKEREKVLQEKHQAILSGLLRDEDNKYCADCHAKGPRWASWNLGVFLCIRCAGIHRNLGVHISRVKSVNLDSWTPEQMFMVQEVGNSRAMAVYEANVPDVFRRPQTDSALEVFIRDKYERKRYIAREWIPPKPPSKIGDTQANDEPRRKEKKSSSSAKPTRSSEVQLNNVGRPKSSQPASNGVITPAAKAASAPAPVKAPPSAGADLLGLNVGSNSASNAAAANSANNDPFGDFLSAAAVDAERTSPGAAPANVDSATFNEKPSNDITGDNDLFKEKPKSTKETIMALYGSGGGGQSQTLFGVPGTMEQQSITMLQSPHQRSVSPNLGSGSGPILLGHGQVAVPGGFGAAFNEGGVYMAAQVPPQQPGLQAGFIMQNGTVLMANNAMIPTVQQSMMPSQPGMMRTSQGQGGAMTSQAGMITSQSGMRSSLMTSQAGLVTSQAGMMTTTSGLMGAPMPGMMPHPGMMTSPMPGVVGYQQGMVPNLGHQMGHASPMHPSMMMASQQQQQHAMPQQQQLQQQQQQQAMMMMPGNMGQQNAMIMMGQHQPAHMYTTANTQHLQQVQQQMASLRLGGPVPSLMNMQPQGALAAANGGNGVVGGGWVGQPTGQTLSNNLWQ